MTTVDARASTLGGGERRRRPTLAGKTLPYALVLPAVVVLLGVLAYPIYFLLRTSLQDYGRPQLFGAEPAPYVGLDNYVEFFSGGDFVPVVIRTLLFTTACVVGTVGLALLIALLLGRLNRVIRFLVIVAMMFAWAMPPVVAVSVWGWMVDFEFGVLNWLIDQLPGVDFQRHHWFIDPVQGFSVISAVVIWVSIPFVAVTLYAALTQVPQELVEAARIDGASRWGVFRNVVLPIIAPVLVMMILLSIIWDFQIINQILVMLDGRPAPDYWTLPIYSFMKSFGGGGEYGLGSAAAIVTVIMLFVLTFGYIRRLVRIQEMD